MRWFFNPKREEVKTQRKQRKAISTRAEDKEIRREIKHFSKLIPRVLANCGVYYFVPKSHDDTGWGHHQNVKIIEARYNSDAIYLRVDTRELPHNSDITKLYEPGILYTLTDACGRQVRFGNEPGKPDHNPGAGAWYVIMRDGAVSMIPRVFSFREAIRNIPPKSGPLAHIIGIAENKRLKLGNLATMPHLLIGGSTGTGKSNYINSLLIQLLWRNAPDKLQFLMIDLKGGVELKAYEHIPHLWRPIVKVPEMVIPAMIEFEGEMHRREGMFEQRRVKDIAHWNRLYSAEHLPYLVLIVDELAQLLKNPDNKLRSEGEKRLGSIMQISRAMGGHVILCTQRPSSDVVTGYIKTNAPARLAFAVPQKSDSIVMIDRGYAAGLEPVGRAIYVYGARHVEVQTPYVPSRLIQMALKKICARPEAKKSKAVTLEDMLAHGLDHMKGELASLALFSVFKGSLSKTRIERMLKDADDQTFVIHGKPYRVTNYGTGKGRRLEPDDPIILTQSRGLLQRLLKGASYDLSLSQSHEPIENQEITV